MSSGHRYELATAAARDLRLLSPSVQRRIIAALDRLIDEPSRSAVKKPRGVEHEWRLRVGDWRIRFQRDDEHDVIYVLRILSRDRAHRG